MSEGEKPGRQGERRKKAGMQGTSRRRDGAPRIPQRSFPGTPAEILTRENAETAQYAQRLGVEPRGINSTPEERIGFDDRGIAIELESPPETAEQKEQKKLESAIKSDLQSILDEAATEYYDSVNIDRKNERQGMFRRFVESVAKKVHSALFRNTLKLQTFEKKLTYNTETGQLEYIMQDVLNVYDKYGKKLGTKAISTDEQLQNLELRNSPYISADLEFTRSILTDSLENVFLTLIHNRLDIREAMNKQVNILSHSAPKYLKKYRKKGHSLVPPERKLTDKHYREIHKIIEEFIKAETRSTLFSLTDNDRFLPVMDSVKLKIPKEKQQRELFLIDLLQGVVFPMIPKLLERIHKNKLFEATDVQFPSIEFFTEEMMALLKSYSKLYRTLMVQKAGKVWNKPVRKSLLSKKRSDDAQANRMEAAEADRAQPSLPHDKRTAEAVSMAGLYKSARTDELKGVPPVSREFDTLSPPTEKIAEKHLEMLNRIRADELPPVEKPEE